MGMVDKIRSGYRTVKRYTGATVLGLGIAAVPAAASYGLYRLYQNWADSHAVNILAPDVAEKNTIYRDLLRESWNTDLGTYLTSPANNKSASFVWDPSRSTWNAERTACEEQIIFSEGMDFGLRKALQMNDQAAFMQLRNGVRILSQDGLPAWKSFMIDGRLVIKNDRDAASALDADVGIAYNFLEAANRLRNGHFEETGDFTEANLVKESQQMMRIIYERGIKQVGPHLLFGPSEDWGFEAGGLIYNVSYPALYMLEAFAKADPNPNHNWAKVVSDNQIIRERIVNLSSLLTGRKVKNEQGKLIDETVPISENSSQISIPDWVSVTWSPERGFEFYVPGARSYETGYDAYRTLLNIALDATLARDENIRNANIKLAQQLLQKILPQAGQSTNDILQNVYKLGVTTWDKNEATGKMEKMTIVCREMILGVYTAMAYAAGSEYYSILAKQLVANYENGRANKLNAPNNEQYCPSSTPYSQDIKVSKTPIEDRYYDQFIIWLATQSLESAYRRFDYEIYPTGTDKEKQDFCRRHSCDYGIFGEYVPLPPIPYIFDGRIAGPQERAELNLAKLIVRRDLEGWYDTPGLALDEAGSWSGLQYKSQAVLEYAEILRADPSADISRSALNGLNGAHIDLGLSGDQKIGFFRAELSRSNNPYLQLGLAESLLTVYRKAETTEALNLTQELSRHADLELAARAELISVQAHVRIGENINDHLKNTEFQTLGEIQKFIRDNFMINPQLEPAVLEELNRFAARAERDPSAPPLMEDLEALKELNRRVWFDPAIKGLSAFASRTGLSTEASSLLQLQLADLYLASGRNYFSTEDVATAVSYYRLIRPADLPEDVRPYAKLRLIEALKTSALLPFFRKDINIYTLTTEQKLDLSRDPAFIEAQQELAKAILTVNPADKISLLQLLTRQMELKNLSTTGPLLTTGQTVEQILSLDIIPQHRLRGQFERIIYFLENDQLSKARADIESLLRITDDLASQTSLSSKLLPEETINQLRGLIIAIRDYQRDKTNGQLEKDLQDTLDALIALDEQDNSVRADLLCDSLQNLIPKNTGERYYEELVVLIQRIIEENYLLRNIYSSEDLIGKLLAQREELEDIQNLLAGDQPRIEDALEDLNYIVDHSGEDAVDSKLYKHLLGTYISVSWGLFNADFAAAEALMLEIVEKPHPEAQNPLAQKLILTLRDKENRGFMTELLALSPGDRNQVLFNLGQMYVLKGNKTEARKIFCEILEIDPELEGSELEAAIQAAEERSQANSPYARELRKVLQMR